MPKGQSKIEKTRKSSLKTMRIQTELFKVTVNFSSKGSNPKVWKFLKSQIAKEFQGFQEVAGAIMQMSDSELDMLEY